MASCSGIAFDRAGNCFVCDLKHSAVFRYDAETRRLERFASSGIRVPNYPVVDEERGFLYVSDSVGDPGPGIYRYDLATGDGGIWCPGPTRFANGMAMAPDRKWLYVVESNVPASARVAILADGSAGPMERVVADVEGFPTALPSRRTGRCSSPATSRAASIGCERRASSSSSSRTARRPSLPIRPISPSRARQDVHGQSRPLAHHRDRPFEPRPCSLTGSAPTRFRPLAGRRDFSERRLSLGLIFNGLDSAWRRILPRRALPSIPQ